jgi:hypothetical protein
MKGLKMTTEIVVALIALAGVILSIVASLLASMRITNTELQKLRTEIQQSYADKLVERRLEVYPSLYTPLSNFTRVIRFGSLSKSAFEQLRTQMEELDSKHSVLFSGRTGVIFHRFLMMLAELTEMPDETIQKKYATDDEKRELRHRIGEVELALKSDLGIYVVEFADPQKSFSSYQEIVDVVTPKK